MNGEIAASVITGLLLAIGATGIILPVLPGSITIIIGLLIWAIVIGGSIGWTTFAIGTLLCLLGMTATYVLTGRRLKRHRIPNRSIIVAAVAAIIGIFVIPGFGLIIGFVAGLFLSELHRTRDARTAVFTSWEALKATGLGLLVEFGLGSLAILTWIVGLVMHFT